MNLRFVIFTTGDKISGGSQGGAAGGSAGWPAGQGSGGQGQLGSNMNGYLQPTDSISSEMGVSEGKIK